MASVEELVMRKVEEIKNALEKGCQVFLGYLPVRSIDVVRNPRAIVVIVNGETMMYKYDFLRRRLRIICPQG